MKRFWLIRPMLLLALTVAPATGQARPADNDELVERVRQSIEVLQALTSAPDDAIPEYILERAEAIVVVPSLVKGGFIVGAEHGRGIMSVREPARNAWSAPAFVSMSGGSFGAQIGVQSVDLMLIVVNRDGIDELLKDEFTLGTSASVTAGPVGRSTKAATDLLMSAKILAYSRAKGIFAGATLEGSTLRADRDANENFYGMRLDTNDIVIEKQHQVSLPAMAQQWRDTLARITGSLKRN